MVALTAIGMGIFLAGGCSMRAEFKSDCKRGVPILIEEKVFHCRPLAPNDNGEK